VIRDGPTTTAKSSPSASSPRVMIRSAHCTADAIMHSVRGLDSSPPDAQASLDAALPGSRPLWPARVYGLHPCQDSPFVRYSLAPHSDSAQYLKTSHSDRKAQVKVARVEMRRRKRVAAVMVTATMPGCRLAAGWVRRRFPRGNLGAGGHYIVRRMCHLSDKLGLNTFVRDTRNPGARPEYWIELIITFT
jgi:hypothetical protein